MRLYRKFIRPVHCYPGQSYEPKTELVEKEEKWYPEEEREHLEEKYGYLNEGHFSNLLFEEKYEPYLLKEQEADNFLGLDTKTLETLTIYANEQCFTLKEAIVNLIKHGLRDAYGNVLS